MAVHAKCPCMPLLPSQTVFPLLSGPLCCTTSVLLLVWAAVAVLSTTCILAAVKLLVVALPSLWAAICRNKGCKADVAASRACLHSSACCCSHSLLVPVPPCSSDTYAGLSCCSHSLVALVTSCNNHARTGSPGCALTKADDAVKLLSQVLRAWHTWKAAWSSENQRS